MLTSLHDAISSQKWNLASLYLRLNKLDPNKKGKHNLSARELAIDNINRTCIQKNLWETVFQTPLETHLYTIACSGWKGGVGDIREFIVLGANVNQRNENGDNALMTYLTYVSSITNGDKNWPSLDVIKLLIEEGCDLAPNLKGETPVTFAREKFGEKFAPYIERHTKEYSSAVKIQRAWRRMKYRRKQSFGYQPARINFPFHPLLSQNPATPQIDNSIDPTRANDWVELHEKEDQPLAMKVLEKIDHISFARFFFALRKSVKKFNTLMMSMPPSNRDYVILLDPRKEKSISWVTSLALPFLEHPPAQVITWDLLNTVRDDIHHVVVFDDAIYSGNQISDLVNELLKFRVIPPYQNILNAELHLVVPYISEFGKKRLSGKEVDILHHETMADFKKEELKIYGDTEKMKIYGTTATYFDHKIAQEGISTINIISSGKTINGKPGIQFIPPTHEPYKSI